VASYAIIVITEWQQFSVLFAFCYRPNKNKFIPCNEDLPVSHVNFHFQGTNGPQNLLPPLIREFSIRAKFHWVYLVGDKAYDQVSCL